MDMPRDDEIRLAMGEMTPDQMRTARAAIRWILSRSARPEVERIEHLQMQIGYLAAMVSLHTGREIPALVEEAARKTSPKPQHGESKEIK